LEEVREFHDLPHAGLVEKDFYVVKALRVLAGFNAESAHLVFGGGTALCRAHKIIQRMSEDIDLKIVSDEPLSGGARKRFRLSIGERLLEAGFQFDAEDRTQVEVHDGGKTFVFHLPYKALAPAVGSLRPEVVKVEISSWPLYLASEDRSVISYVAAAKKEQAEIAAIACVDVTETAAEKFVALTRRIGEQRASGDMRDQTLLRHVYDLHHLKGHLDFNAMGSLVRTIMASDQATRTRGFPAYADDCIGETMRALDALAADSSYREGFDTFQRDMVYGTRPSYDECMVTLEEMRTLIQ
jgi:predicted nucleotidyltransferase component of viral defense system